MVCRNLVRRGDRRGLAARPLRPRRLRLQPPQLHLSPHLRCAPTTADGGGADRPTEEMTCEERDGKTTVTTCSIFPNKQGRDQVRQSGMEAGADGAASAALQR